MFVWYSLIWHVYSKNFPAINGVFVKVPILNFCSEMLIQIYSYFLILYDGRVEVAGLFKN